uniref:Secreted protein n=1 Tax=Kalanchoe fedtschenkoi TaxID=63787 RepID=A0A7N0TXG3_KALFE
MAFWCMSFPLLYAITFRTSFSTPSLFTSESISIPTPHLLQENQQFVCCSAKNGQHIIGTPALILSIVEFHPQCVRNPPTDGWLRTCF